VQVKAGFFSLRAEEDSLQLLATEMSVFFRTLLLRQRALQPLHLSGCFHRRLRIGHRPLRFVLQKMQFVRSYIEVVNIWQWVEKKSKCHFGISTKESRYGKREM
jgi:hypothetical protein